MQVQPELLWIWAVAVELAVLGSCRLDLTNVLQVLFGLHTHQVIFFYIQFCRDDERNARYTMFFSLFAELVEFSGGFRCPTGR